MSWEEKLGGFIKSPSSDERDYVQYYCATIHNKPVVDRDHGRMDVAHERKLTFNILSNEFCYITDLDPNYDVQEFYRDLNQRLFPYRAWAAHMSWNVSELYSYEEMTDTKQQQYHDHINKWIEISETIDVLLKHTWIKVMESGL